MASSSKQLKMSDGESCPVIKKRPKRMMDPGISEFKEVLEKADFVDKSLLIEALFNDDASRVLITAPRRFGKSTNMDMIKTFAEIQVDEDGEVIKNQDSSNHKIFQDLFIFKNYKDIFDEHFAKYPVISVDFKDVDGSSFEEVLAKFRSALHDAFKKHIYLLKSKKLNRNYKKAFHKYSNVNSYDNLSRDRVERGLLFLSECLYEHFDKKRVIILIDEYDTPINNTMCEENINMEQINTLIRTILSTALKNNKFLVKALLTGISYFASVGLSGANNISKCMFLTNHPYVSFYGLTEDEVATLLSKFNVGNEEQRKIKDYYNGYCSLNGIKLFSIWSILSYLKHREFKGYWEDSGIMSNLRRAINVPEVRSSVEKLCLGLSEEIEILEKIAIDDITDLRKICLQKEGHETQEVLRADPYLCFLLEQGYLIIDKRVIGSTYTVKARNIEICEQFRAKLLKFYGESIIYNIQKCATSFDKLSVSLVDKDFNDFITNFNELLDKSKSKIGKKNENAYQCLLFFVLFKTKFSLCTEYIIRKGRLDIILWAMDLGIIIELKYKKSSGEALKQIKMKYVNAFDNDPLFKDVKKHIYIGLNVDENNKADVSVCNELKGKVKIFS